MHDFAGEKAASLPMQIAFASRLHCDGQSYSYPTLLRGRIIAVVSLLVLALANRTASRSNQVPMFLNAIHWRNGCYSAVFGSALKTALFDKIGVCRTGAYRHERLAVPLRAEDVRIS
jgi:hypothetical protein